MKNESEKPHEYQSGYYCKQNFLKFLIADVSLSMPDQTFTSADVEALTEINRKKIGNALWHYKKVGVPYFRRLPKKDPKGLIRWKVTKSGEQAWWAYFMRIKRGFDLNRCSNKIKRMPTHGKFEFEKPQTADDLNISSIPKEGLADYLGLTKYGVEVLGLTQENLMKVVAGL
jgi:hypothetical protein